MWYGNVSVWKSGGERGSGHDKSVSVGPNRLPAAAFKVALCVLRAIITKPLRLGQWSPVVIYCMPSLASSCMFITYTHTLQKWVTTGKNVMCDSSSRHSGAQLWWPLSLTSSWTQFMSLSACLIWSVCSLLTQQFLQQPCQMCAHVSILCLSLLMTGTKTNNTTFKSQTPFLLKICPFLYICTMIRLYYSAHCTLSQYALWKFFWISWNLLSQVLCQDKSSLLPAHSRWAGVQRTQSLASSCESRQRYCQSSCWH